MSAENGGSRLGLCLSAFVLGVAAGATIALLTTGQSGRETREQLKTAAKDLGRRMEHIPGTIQRTLSRAVTAGQSAFEQARSDAS